MRYDITNGITLDRLVPTRNVLTLDGHDVELAYLENGPRQGKAGNSFIFRLVGEDWGDGYVVKICAFHKDCTRRDSDRRRRRFEREIEALRTAKTKGLGESVVDIICDGVLKICGFEFRYFVMPQADSDLGVFLENEEVSLSSKLHLCHKICEAVSQLHEIGIYHRDLKPGNLMMFDQSVRVADLGLCAYRVEDDLDRGERKIGPFGFLSPEAVNRYCATKRSSRFGEMCGMDNASDFFQLGLVFWYILQGDVPVGQLVSSDLIGVEDGVVFEKVMLPLLQFDKGRRANYGQIACVLGELARP